MFRLNRDLSTMKLEDCRIRLNADGINCFIGDEGSHICPTRPDVLPLKLRASFV